MKVVTREYLHKSQAFDPRGGPETADHVDIMGNTEMISEILHIASGAGESVREVVVSDIRQISKKFY